MFLLLLVVSALSQSTFLPFEFATPAVQYAGPNTRQYFQAAFCNQQAYYDGLTAFVSINLQSNLWNVPANQYVAVQVSNDPNQASYIQNNSATGTYQDSFTFVYNASYGDLYFSTLTPYSSSGGISYTITLSFPGSTLTIPTSPVLPLHTKRVSFEAATYIPMKQFYNSPNSVGTIITGSETPNLNTFLFCPSQQAYSVTVQAVCTDPTGGVTLFVCIKPSDFPCTAQKASATATLDDSSVTVASVTLNGNLGDITQFQTAVYGGGKYQQPNSYYLTVNQNS